MVKTAKGCTASAASIVRVSGAFLMPSAFTPNRDGLNDLFIIPAYANIELEEFSVFDRWGIRIFTTANPGKGWDGQVKGSVRMLASMCISSGERIMREMYY
ncbi:MAG: gliding motility-associated C-terminal domain-containing protein [Chitinophagaceae bacterium]